MNTLFSQLNESSISYSNSHLNLFIQQPKISISFFFLYFPRVKRTTPTTRWGIQSATLPFLFFGIICIQFWTFSPFIIRFRLLILANRISLRGLLAGGPARPKFIHSFIDDLSAVSTFGNPVGGKCYNALLPTSLLPPPPPSHTHYPLFGAPPDTCHAFRRNAPRGWRGNQIANYSCSLNPKQKPRNAIWMCERMHLKKYVYTKYYLFLGLSSYWKLFSSSFSFDFVTENDLFHNLYCSHFQLINFFYCMWECWCVSSRMLMVYVCVSPCGCN